MISREDVQHIATLARIELDERQIETFQKEFAEILSYFENLGRLDVDGVEPMTHSAAEENILREDEPEESSAEQQERLQSMASDRKGRYIKTKPILGDKTE